MTTSKRPELPPGWMITETNGALWLCRESSTGRCAYVMRNDDRAVLGGHAWEAFHTEHPKWCEYLAGIDASLAERADELREALRILDAVAPRPWFAELDDPHDEQDSGEFDDGEWVVTDSNDREIDRTSGSNTPSNGAWAREYVQHVNDLGADLTKDPTP